MTVRKIARMGSPVLDAIAEHVEDPQAPEIGELVQDMKDTLVDIGGSGIAAPQIYVSKRVVVYRVTNRLIADDQGSDDAWVVMINPILVPLDNATEMGWERCLSLPGLHGKVPRYQHVEIRYQTPDGKEIKEEVRGAKAVLLQHECDHLDGVLYPMRMIDLTKLEYNEEPGHLAEDIDRGADVWPVLKKLVDDWQDRDRWTG